jgi:hypothetical protein
MQDKQDKQKVTLYFPQQLHRQLKIRAAVESEPMSAIVERAVAFYLEHPEVVDEHSEPFGRTHRVYSCPVCQASAVLRDGELVGLGSQPGILAEDTLSIERALTVRASSPDTQDTSLTVAAGSDTESREESQENDNLVPC